MNPLLNFKSNQRLRVGKPALRILLGVHILGLCFLASMPAQAGWLNFLDERFGAKPVANKAPKKPLKNKVPPKASPKQETEQRLGAHSTISASGGAMSAGSLLQNDTNEADSLVTTSMQPSAQVIGQVQVFPEAPPDSQNKISLTPNATGDLSHFGGPIEFLAQSAEQTKVDTSSSLAPPAKELGAPSVNADPPSILNEQRALSKGVSFNAWAKANGVNNSIDSMPDPQRDDDTTWTKMEVSPDLPPRVAILGEDLIGAVAKQLPSERAKRLAMPYDEFKLRVRDAVLAFPDVGVAQSQLGFAQASASESRAPLLPQINGFTESGKRSVGADSYLGTPAYNRDGTNYGVSVRQVLFDFGAVYFGFQSGKAKERAAQELLNSKRSEQALKTVASVIDLERARAQMGLAKDNASSRLAIVKLVRERYETGGGSKPDIIRAEARYAESLATVTNAQNRLKAAEAAYREAFAANPVGIIRGPNFEVPVDKLDASAEQLAGTYPGLQQLAQLRDSADAEAKSAFAKTLPSFNLAYDNIVNGVSAPLAPSRTVNALLQFKYNFYTGGAESARKDQADYKAKQAEQEFQSGLRQYERVLTQNQEDVRNSDALLAARKAAASSAISSMRAVREQFAFNKGTLLDLLTVQEGLFNAGRDLVDAEADRQISRYRYLHLTSGLDRLFDLSEASYDVRSEVRADSKTQLRSEKRK